MRRRLARLWNEQRLIFVAFVAALLLTLLFAVRLAVFTVYWMDPEHSDQPVEGWMTPRYVAHSWNVPPDLVAGVLGIEPGSSPRRTIAAIARDRGMSVEELARILEDAIREGRDGQPANGRRDGARP